MFPFSLNPKCFTHFSCNVGLFVGCLLLAGCGTQGKKEAEKELQDTVDALFVEPDVYFENALGNVEQGNNQSASESIGDAIFYVRSINVQADTLHDPILDFAVAELEELQIKLDSGSNVTEEDLRRAFVSVDWSITAYHLSIVQDYYLNGTPDGKGLERLQRALARMDYVAKYQGYPFSEENVADIAVIKGELEDAERSSPGMWEKVNKVVSRVKKKRSEW